MIGWIAYYLVGMTLIGDILMGYPHENADGLKGHDVAKLIILGPLVAPALWFVEIPLRILDCLEDC